MKILTKKRILAFTLATTMAMPFALTACTPSNNNNGDDDVYTITLDYNDGIHRNGAILVDKEDGKVKIPKTPETEGNKFVDWYTAAEGGEKVDLSTLKVTSDITVYAHWTPAVYDVEFDWNLGTEGYETSNVKYEVPYKTTIGGENGAENYPVPADKPEGLTNNQFLGWNDKKAEADEKKTNNNLFPALIKKDVTYYAAWADADDKIYNITYNVGNVGASAVAGETYVEGTPAMTLPGASANGYEFKGWSHTEKAPTADDITADYEAFGEYTPTGDETEITLYAVWQIHKYNVRFMGYSGVHSTISGVQPGSKIEAPDTNPTREGYSFNGWYTLASGGTEINFDTYTVPVQRNNGANVNLYAHWEVLPVVTTVFDAEFTPIDPNHQSPGYSGNTTTGYGIIVVDKDFGADTQHQQGSVYANEKCYTSWMYEPGFTLTFNITASQATDATLVLRAAGEAIFFSEGANSTFTSSEGPTCIQIIVNGTAVDYGSFTVLENKFEDFSLGTVHLNEGSNEILFVVSNDTPYGGTAKAAAPVVDCIKLLNAQAELSWKPAYENLEHR